MIFIGTAMTALKSCIKDEKVGAAIIMVKRERAQRNKA